MLVVRPAVGGSRALRSGVANVYRSGWSSKSRGVISIRVTLVVVIIRPGAVQIGMVRHRGFNPSRSSVPIQDVFIGCPEEPVQRGGGGPAG